MQIGDVAKKVGVTVSRIRFYESEGLLPPAARAANGYRQYGDREVKILAFIERAQRLGFSLREIAAFLDAPAAERSAKGLLPRLRAKLTEIDLHIREARRRRGEITRLIDELSATPPGD